MLKLALGESRQDRASPHIPRIGLSGKYADAVIIHRRDSCHLDSIVPEQRVSLIAIPVRTMSHSLSFDLLAKSMGGYERDLLNNNYVIK